jgi:putative membrane protein
MAQVTAFARSQAEVNTMRNTGFAVAALALALTVGCSKNDGATTDGANGAAVGTAGRADNGISSGDRDFVRDVAAMNTAELELARIANTRAAGPDVKQFAQMMVTDHTTAAEKLKTFASQHSIEVPAQLDEKHRDLSMKLSEKQGLEFDRAYADMMVDAHQDFVNKLESRIDKDTLSRSTTDNRNGPDGKVKAVAVAAEKSDNPNTMALNEWAAATYPVAYAHLQAAKDMRDGVRKRSTN